MSRKRHNKNVILMGLIVFSLIMAIGYSALSSNLRISGSSNIIGDFKVVFTDIQEGTMSGATSGTYEITAPTTATFRIALEKPGSSGEYLIKVENQSKFEAIVDSISGLDEANATEPTDIKFSVEDLNEGDTLKPGETKVFKVKVVWDSSATEIPENSKSLTLSVNYRQGNKGDATPPTNVSLTKGDITENSIQVIASAIDEESEIVKYEFSNDEGKSWIDNGNNTTYVFTELVPSTNYNLQVRVTNADGLQTISDTLVVSTLNKQYNVGDVIYYDPINGTKCSAGSEWTTSNTTSTCYKWNVISSSLSSSNTVDVLLDHNLENAVAWGSSGNSRPNNLLTNLDTKTSSWQVETLTSSDNDNILYCGLYDAMLGCLDEESTYEIEYEGKKAKILSAQAITNITGDTTWSPSNQSNTVYSQYSWLYTNLNSSQTTSFVHYGYWTTSNFTAGDGYAWVMLDSGKLTYDSITFSSRYGIRPVVRLLKSNI